MTIGLSIHIRERCHANDLFGENISVLHKAPMGLSLKFSMCVNILTFKYQVSGIRFQVSGVRYQVLNHYVLSVL